MKIISLFNHFNPCKHSEGKYLYLALIFLQKVLKIIYLAHGLQIVKYFTLIRPWAYYWVGYVNLRLIAQALGRVIFNNSDC